MPSVGKPNAGSLPGKPPARLREKKSELDSALGQISDESVAETNEGFQDLLAQAKGDTSELVRQNAEELERRRVLLKSERSTRRTSIFFVENQKRDLPVFIDSQPAQAQNALRN